ncbi:hypothetical protein [Kitasatospora sp. A2-31]|uniref:hypothetical protein n=1 Tax=Kitasatospora sp. A2-31 TaxID=2916414 RepID=UPI001EEC53F9|nr:hypothetical protein [Kitasatospora sp. A2-31]MCG6494947.1 hypothetical protein [Kitasatospora sp. A2-31]
MNHPVNHRPPHTPGELLHDRRTRRTGVYMDTIGGRVYLRPVGGGVEWTVRPEHVTAPPPQSARARSLS